MKRVLLVTGSLGMGGIEKLVAGYSTFLKKSECQLYYLIFSGSECCHEKEVLDNGARIIRIPSPRNKIDLYRSIVSVLKKHGPFDIVHSHILFSSGLVMRAACKNSVKIRIAHSHDNLTYVRATVAEKAYQFIMRHFLNRYSTKRVACSIGAGKYLFGENFLKNGSVIKNRIKLDVYKFSESDRRAVRREIGVSDNQLLIGTIGRIEEQKNQKFVVDIMDDDKLVGSNAKAIIIGDGRKKNELIAYVRNKKQEENVLLLGKKENAHRYLSAMDVFVLPSIHEGLGLVLIEAQANGLPCITTMDIVPDEVKVLESFRFIPRERCKIPGEWVDNILKAKREDSEISIEALTKKGYDITGSRNDLLELYEYEGE